jgi:arabinogalactan endo-1,4-beta-galactosidase
MIRKFIYILYLLSLFSCSKNDAGDVVQPAAKSLEIKGVDISFLPEIRQFGTVFYNKNNQAEPMLTTLKNAGVNTIRLRLWKNPTDSNSSFTTVKNLVTECKNLGFKTLLSIHYSDTWADPSQQQKPQQWQGISFNQLKDSVYNYTKKIITEIRPDYIQIGNEINYGFILPEGSNSNLLQMKSLISKAVQAVRDNNSTTKIIIHYAGHDTAATFFNTISDIDYDIIGLSYYPIWHGKDLDILKQNMNLLATNTNKKVMIVETSYPFTMNWNDYTNNIIGLQNQILPAFPATAEGQKNYINKLKEICNSNPNFLGFCYWGAEWVSYKGSTSNNGSSWENQALWDFNNKALPVLDNF